MRVEELKETGIPFEEYGEETCLYAECAAEWLLEKTTLKFNVNSAEEIKALPPGAKLFILKYAEIMKTSETVASESMGGLSQSFRDGSKEKLVTELARELLSCYLKTSAKFYTAKNKWGSSYEY